MTRSKSHNMLNELSDSVPAPIRQQKTSSKGKQGVKRSKSTACLVAMTGSEETPDGAEERQPEQEVQHINQHGSSLGHAQEVVRTRPVNGVLHWQHFTDAQRITCCKWLASYRPH